MKNTILKRYNPSYMVQEYQPISLLVSSFKALCGSWGFSQPTSLKTSTILIHCPSKPKQISESYSALLSWISLNVGRIYI